MLILLESRQCEPFRPARDSIVTRRRGIDRLQRRSLRGRRSASVETSGRVAVRRGFARQNFQRRRGRDHMKSGRVHRLHESLRRGDETDDIIEIRIVVDAWYPGGIRRARVCESRNRREDSRDQEDQAAAAARERADWPARHAFTKYTRSGGCQAIAAPAVPALHISLHAADGDFPPRMPAASTSALTPPARGSIVVAARCCA